MEIYPNIKADTYEEFLLKLLKELHRDREEKRRIRNLNNAGFPDAFNLESIESLSFIEKKENLILYGSVGTGKTHLSIALGVKTINEGKKALFYRVHDLINQLESNDKNKISKVYKKIQRADLLILDELGYLRFHQEGARLIFDIISACYETKSIVITTNIEFGRWKGFLFDEKLTVAIVDRLVHNSHMLIFTGKSYRMMNSLM